MRGADDRAALLVVRRLTGFVRLLADDLEVLLSADASMRKLLSCLLQTVEVGRGTDARLIVSDGSGGRWTKATAGRGFGTLEFHHRAVLLHLSNRQLRAAVEALVAAIGSLGGGAAVELAQRLVAVCRRGYMGQFHVEAVVVLDMMLRRGDGAPPGARAGAAGRGDDIAGYVFQELVEELDAGAAAAHASSTMEPPPSHRRSVVAGLLEEDGGLSGDAGCHRQRRGCHRRRRVRAVPVHVPVSGTGAPRRHGRRGATSGYGCPCVHRPREWRDGGWRWRQLWARQRRRGVGVCVVEGQHGLSGGLGVSATASAGRVWDACTPAPWVSWTALQGWVRIRW